VRKAPSGAFQAPLHTLQPAMLRLQATGRADRKLDPSPTGIARMLQAIVTNEERIKLWEDISSGKRFVEPSDEGRLPCVEPAQELAQARQHRDEHLAETAHAIDYALTTVAYEDAVCLSCRLPVDALDFVQAVADFEPPAMTCLMCKGRGLVRVKRTDAQSVEDFKYVSYFKKVVDDLALCAKVRAGTSDQNQAYTKLEAKNLGLLHKFGSEKQTPLEGDDAEQGVRQGFVDAARRFDPLKKKNGVYCCATYNTVAYSWCRRNSRARHEGQKRVGLYARSVDAMLDSEGVSIVHDITESVGAFGSLRVGQHASKRWGVRDVCLLCGDQSSTDPETWEPTGLCEPCALLPQAEKVIEAQRDAPIVTGGMSRCPTDLRLDLREQISDLPEDERAVISGDLDGLTTPQIAKRLGTTRTKVRGIRSLAYARLRGTLSGYVEALRE